VDNKLFKGLEPKVGEQPALDDYIAAHPEWRIKEDRRQYPGMLIWERKVPLKAGCAAEFKETINTRYDDFVHTRGFALTVQGQGEDIKDHMDALYKLASDPEVHHITEVGVRNVVSSYAFAKAAMERPGMVTYRAHDLEERAANTAMTALTGQCTAINYKFTAGDDLKVPVETTDFMLIDTWHTYKQLAAELELLAPKVRKYLAFHDTVEFAHR
jgi:hypothetical protein